MAEKAAINQTDTGKALEYSIAKAYHDYFSSLGLSVQLVVDAPYNNALASFNKFDAVGQLQFFSAAKSTIASMVKIEPGLISEKSSLDSIFIRLASDAEGQAGDVRDVIFTRPKSKWEIGFSVKNNHDAAKHSRLSPTIDFGAEWLGYPCSQTYFNEINIVFNEINRLRKIDRAAIWVNAFPNLHSGVYVPVLRAFKKELLRLAVIYPDVPEKLLAYLIGRNSFYKIIKNDTFNLVIVKGYNTNNDLSKPYNTVKPVCKVPRILFPSRIIEFLEDPNYLTSLFMTLDKGWQIKFRIHTASSKLETSLKFDVTLIGNPPILFTHYIFP